MSAADHLLTRPRCCQPPASVGATVPLVEEEDRSKMRAIGNVEIGQRLIHEMGAFPGTCPERRRPTHGSINGDHALDFARLIQLIGWPSSEWAQRIIYFFPLVGNARGLPGSVTVLWGVAAYVTAISVSGFGSPLGSLTVPAAIETFATGWWESILSWWKLS